MRALELMHPLKPVRPKHCPAGHVWSECMSWEQRFREMFFVSPAPMSLTTRVDGVFLDVNPSFLALTGYLRDEVIGHSVDDLHFWHLPVEREKLLLMLEQADGPLRYANMRLRTKAGRVRQAVISVGSLIADGDRCLLVIYRDVSAEKELALVRQKDNKALAMTIRHQSQELDQVTRRLERESSVRRRVENRCWESQRMLAALMSHLPGIVYRCRTDEHRTIEYASEGCHTLLGRSPDELIGSPREVLAAHIHEEDRPRVWASIQSAVEEKRPYRMKYRLRHLDGEERWVHERGKGAYDADGNVVALEGLIVDITEERLAHEALYHSEQRRAEAEKLAATGDVAARVAHEINNPLAGIQNAFQAIKDAVPENHPARQFVGPIEREIARIAGIVRRMIELNRSEREEPAPVDLAIVVDDVFTMVSGLAERHRVGLRKRFAGDPARVVLPEGMLRQILYNLIVNAIEASPPTETVWVEVVRADRQLQFRVTDKGKGIPDSIKTRVFEPFCTTKDRTATGGLGLGLSITRGIVASLQGTIRFESPGGGGTIFVINLPMVRNCEE